jgi:hypothetical protein
VTYGSGAFPTERLWHDPITCIQLALCKMHSRTPCVHTSCMGCSWNGGASSPTPDFHHDVIWSGRVCGDDVPFRTFHSGRFLGGFFFKEGGIHALHLSPSLLLQYEETRRRKEGRGRTVNGKPRGTYREAYAAVPASTVFCVGLSCSI